MGKWVKYRILIILLAGFTYGLYAQENNPPPPTMSSQSNGNGKGPCGKKPDNPGQGIPPPVGLCLPINDYLLPLLLSGIALGGSMVWRLEKKN